MVRILFVCVSLFSFSQYAIAQECGSCSWYGSNFDACCGQSTGWGWENNQSCIGPEECTNNGQTLSGNNSTSGGTSNSGGTCNWHGSNFPLCTSQSSDWGWENNESCVGADLCNSQGGGSSANTSSSSGGGNTNSGNSGSCSGYNYCANGSSDDPDGDGWGWTGSETCIVSGSSADSCGGSFGNSSGNSGGNISGSSCSPGGSVTVVTETIRVDDGGTYDGNCQTFTAGSQLGDGSQSESQDPIFRVENGSTLRNVVIGNNGADGIHLRNNATLDNIYFQNVGEDAISVKESGTYNVSNVEGYDAEDKFFQINAESTLNVENCIIHGAGKALRQNGGTTFRIDVNFNNCDIADMGEGIFRSDSSSSNAHISNSRLHNAGSICIGSWSNCSSSNITQY